MTRNSEGKNGRERKRKRKSMDERTRFGMQEEGRRVKVDKV